MTLIKTTIIAPFALAAAFTAAQGKEIKLTKAEDTIAITIGGEAFTTYHFGKDRAKPVLYPVAGPGGKRMVRDFPFSKDSPGEAHDHIHHESLWYSHGDVNGISFWHIGKTRGKIVHKKFLKSGPDEIATENEWISPAGKAQCSDTTRIRFFSLPDGGRGIDYRVTLRATHGDVKFGDTKEGSMGIRTHPALRLQGKVATGKAVNSGGVEGKGVWGKPSKWLYYWGKVDGATVGVGIFDHPSNPRHPTTWHARDYGLIAANPFGYSYFLGKKRGTGDIILKNGEEISFRYAFVFLGGDKQGSKVEQIYNQWSSK
jgi:hypothetical protein